MIFRDIIRRFSQKAQPYLEQHSLRQRPSLTVISHKKNGTRGAAKKIGEESYIISRAESSREAPRVRTALTFLLVGGVLLGTLTLLSLSQQGVHLQKDVESAIKIHFQHLRDGFLALKDKRTVDAQKAFSLAQKGFATIKSQTWFAHLPRGKDTLADPLLLATDNIIKGGTKLAEAGSGFAQTLDLLSTLPEKFTETLKSPQQPPSGASLTAQLRKELPLLTASTQALDEARTALNTVPLQLVPTHLRDEFTFARGALTEITTALNTLTLDLPALLTLFGDAHPHTFAILLQNSDELRPSGGFIGNIGIAELNDGYLTKNELYDVYHFDHQLNETIIPPAEVAPVNSRLFLRDANYSGHFPLSAARAAQLLEKEGGPGVDTVIALNKNMVIELLKLTGPIEVPGLKKPLTAENFTSIVSYIVEAKIDGRENPKAILQNFLPIFQKALFERAPLLEVGKVFAKAVAQKDILFYSKDDDVQAFFERHSAAGLLPKPQKNQDYLAIVHSSVGGNKSDRFIREVVNHATELEDDGTLVDVLTLTRTHTWNDSFEKNLRALVKSFGYGDIPRPLIEILGRSRSLHALRIYVPAEAKLITSSGFPVTTQFDEELGMTYFSTTMEVGVKDTRTLTLRYQLPFSLTMNPVGTYEFTAIQQPGQHDVLLKKSFFSSENLHSVGSVPPYMNIDPNGGIHYEIPLINNIHIKNFWTQK